ncbi:CopG family ribbon-helix-helix protein [Candidatus Binatus sp.]|uniref:CopG family ribbon-helix-helix protein n=1 Tax=Candidatus Binatus sp. TaxID=2811406 RepID=UPI003C739784
MAAKQASAQAPFINDRAPFPRGKGLGLGWPGPLAVWQCVHHNTIMSEIMTIRVDRKTKSRLDKLAKAMERTKSYVAAEAIRAYVDLNEWQITEIKAAITEAEAGDFASEKEVQAVIGKWRRRARKMA